jgi:Protein of unknown function (DUF4231)
MVYVVIIKLSEASYKQERLQKQIDWHSKKARENKLRFRLCQIIILIASAIIPIINVGSIAETNIANYQTRIISSIIGAIIVVITAITQLEKYQENWILYRTSTELLKKEKYFFENNVGEYSNLGEEERNKLLVERVESIVSAETSKYFTIHQLPQKNSEKTNQKQ